MNTEEEILAKIAIEKTARQLADDAGDLSYQEADEFDRRIASLRRKLRELQTLELPL